MRLHFQSVVLPRKRAQAGFSSLLQHIIHVVMSYRHYTSFVVPLRCPQLTRRVLLLRARGNTLSRGSMALLINDVVGGRQNHMFRSQLCLTRLGHKHGACQRRGVPSTIELSSLVFT